ncbi:unnamed protein product [Urochloa humidicola]
MSSRSMVAKYEPKGYWENIDDNDDKVPQSMILRIRGSIPIVMHCTYKVPVCNKNDGYNYFGKGYLKLQFDQPERRFFVSAFLRKPRGEKQLEEFMLTHRAQYKYELLRIILVATCAALIIQPLTARLGVVKGKCLTEHYRAEYLKVTSFV